MMIASRRQQLHRQTTVTTFRFLFTALGIVFFTIAHYSSEYPICVDGLNELAATWKAKTEMAANRPAPPGPPGVLRSLNAKEGERQQHQHQQSQQQQQQLQEKTPEVTSTTPDDVKNAVSTTTLIETDPAASTPLVQPSEPSSTTTTTTTAAAMVTDAANTTKTTATTKSKLVLHIGPLKTGTTTIQVDLTHLGHNRLLEQDGWYYATEGQALDDGSTDNNIRPMKDLCGADPTFISDLKATLDRLKGRNVVHSKEGWSVDFANNPNLYQQIHDALSNDWDITIVSGYRPYFDWVVSLWTQTQKRDKFKFPDPHHWPWHEENGQHVKRSRLFPNNYGYWITKLEWFTDSIIDRASPYFHIATYNMNDPRGPSAAFVCDCLEGATTSCNRMIQQLEENKDKITYENKGSLNPIHYDGLSLLAGAKGLIDETQFTRYTLQKAVQAHTETTLHQTALKDWPMFCPGDDILTELWDKTVRLEKQYMAKLWDTNPNRETDLKAKFQKQIDERSFCHVDFETILKDAEWLRFYAQFQGNNNNNNSTMDVPTAVVQASRRD